MGWVCQEFRVAPREALLTLGYDPDELPWSLLGRIAEGRRFAEVHREYERIMAPATKPKQAAEDMANLKRNPLWPEYEAALVAVMTG